MTVKSETFLATRWASCKDKLCVGLVGHSTQREGQTAFGLRWMTEWKLSRVKTVSLFCWLILFTAARADERATTTPRFISSRDDFLANFSLYVCSADQTTWVCAARLRLSIHDQQQQNSITRVLFRSPMMRKKLRSSNWENLSGLLTSCVSADTHNIYERRKFQNAFSNKSHKIGKIWIYWYI